ncbi:MAG: hypothetical protein GY930_17235 [bacterium]|nr:hypothetical protein [bacterium]
MVPITLSHPTILTESPPAALSSRLASQVRVVLFDTDRDGTFDSTEDFTSDEWHALEL